MFGLGAGEILMIAVFALLFIGPKKLPELAKGLGKGLREFQRAKNDLMEHVNNPELDNTKKTTSITPSEPVLSGDEKVAKLKPGDNSISKKFRGEEALDSHADETVEQADEIVAQVDSDEDKSFSEASNDEPSHLKPQS